ncbi:MAG TPA: hypothetical protein VFF53_11145 [Geobacteraceae bacterium]|nr:hypothetical protein [Geobacteraceae bacterium]
MLFSRERRRCKGNIVVGCLGWVGVLALVLITLARKILKPCNDGPFTE